MATYEVLTRKYKPEDYDSVISLWNSANLPIRLKGRDSFRKIQEQVGNGNTIFLVAEINGRVVGAILGTHDGRKGWINRLAIDAELHRKHIAQRLVFKVEEWFKEIGIDVFACVIEGDNTSSMKLFRKAGSPVRIQSALSQGHPNPFRETISSKIGTKYIYVILSPWLLAEIKRLL